MREIWMSNHKFSKSCILSYKKFLTLCYGTSQTSDTRRGFTQSERLDNGYHDQRISRGLYSQSNKYNSDSHHKEIVVSLSEI